jgi:hypothetical protein
LEKGGVVGKIVLVADTGGRREEIGTGNWDQGSGIRDQGSAGLVGIGSAG